MCKHVAQKKSHHPRWLMVEKQGLTNGSYPLYTETSPPKKKFDEKESLDFWSLSAEDSPYPKCRPTTYVGATSCNILHQNSAHNGVNNTRLWVHFDCVGPRQSRSWLHITKYLNAVPDRKCRSACRMCFLSTQRVIAGPSSESGSNVKSATRP